MYKDKLLKLRKEKGLTQQNIADIINVNRGSYSHYEREDDLLTLNNLNIICNYFDVSIDYIFGFTKKSKYDNSKINIDNLIISKRLKELRKINNITQKDLAIKIKTVQQVIANYEKGKNLIALRFLYTICSKYKISADYLLGKIDDPKYLK